MNWLAANDKSNGLFGVITKKMILSCAILLG